MAFSATAGIAAPPAVTESTQSVGVFGISIPFGGDWQPRLNLGYRRATVQPDGALQGGEIRLTLNPANLRDVQLRGLLLRGTVDHSGALGAGWDFGQGRPFASGGVLLPHVNVIADFGLGGWQPNFSFGVDSAGPFTAPTPAPVFAPCGAPAGPGSISLAC